MEGPDANTDRGKQPLSAVKLSAAFPGNAEVVYTRKIAISIYDILSFWSAF